MKISALKIGIMVMAAGIASLAQAAPQAANDLSDVEVTQGFTSMFNGSLKSFNDNFVNYKTQDSTNVALPANWKYDSVLNAITTDTGQASDIRSVSKYADFDFRFDYRNSGDGGVYYRFLVRETVPWLSGIEFSILDDYDNCKGCAGAALDFYGPQGLIYRPFSTKEWNTARLVVIKDSVEHWLNGQKVVSFKYHSKDFWSRFDASRFAATNLTYKVPGNRSAGYITSGYVGFQTLKTGRWQLRNIRINKTSPKLGVDKWWSAATTGIAAPKAARTGSPRERDINHGALIYRAGTQEYKADGRLSLP